MENKKISIEEWIKELNIHEGSVVSIVGCGGKTTLLKSMARILSRKYKVCAATSTKMTKPKDGTYTEMFIRRVHECRDTIDSPGIYYFADELLTSGKIHDFSAYMLAQAKAYTDLVLIEADGSKGRLLKGWADYEPVIIEDTTVTIGVVTLKMIGETVTNYNVHRIDDFTKLTGLKEKDVVTEETMEKMINDPSAMFKGCHSRKVLYVNQVDSVEELEIAKDFFRNHSVKVDHIYVGSMKNGYVWKIK